MAQSDGQLSKLLATLQDNLHRLAQGRDPTTLQLACELQTAIDNIRAELAYPIMLELGNDEVAA
jgi:hypothetical protein